MKQMVKLLDTLQPINVDSNYTYNGVIVPRVTKILSTCIHSDSLMYWANSLGFKHKSYKKTLEEAANIGTHTHDNIDHFLFPRFCQRYFFINCEFFRRKTSHLFRRIFTHLHK